MKNKKQVITEFMLKLYRTVNKLNELEKKPYDFGIGETLYPSEIHTIQAIGDNSGANVTALAQTLGITIPGASQMITKLHKRGFINKVHSVDNDKEVLLILTPKGKKAYDGHEKFHADMYIDFLEYMDDIRPDQIDTFAAILDKIDYYIDHYQK